MAICSECGREVEELIRCFECGKAYCRECANKDPTIKELGICPDCEEVYEAEEDLFSDGRNSKRQEKS